MTASPACRRVGTAILLALALGAAGCLDAAAPQASSEAGREPAWGLALDRLGRLCFVDSDEDVLWRLDAVGQSAALARGIHGHDLYVDGAGNLAGDEAVWDPDWRRWRHGAWRVSPDGQRREVAAPALAPAADAALLVDGRGERYGFGRPGGERRLPVVLYRYGADGSAVRLAGGGPGQADGRGAAAGFEAPRALRWGRDALYATDGAAIRRIGLDGTVTTLASPGLVGGVWPHLLGLDAGGREVLAADFAGRRVLAIRHGGSVGIAAESDFGWSPTGVLRAGDAIYVLERRPAGLLGRLLGTLGPHLRVVLRQDAATGGGRTVASLPPPGAGFLPDLGVDLVLGAAGSLLLLAVGGALLALAERRRMCFGLIRVGRWLPVNVFKVVAWLTVFLALLLLAEEVGRPAADGARLGILALVLLVAALGAQLGPSLLERIRKIGPVELIEQRSPALILALDNLDLEIPASGEDLQPRQLTPSHLFAYRQAEFLVSLIQLTAPEISSETAKQRYWRLLMKVGSVALLRGQAARAIDRLTLLQTLSNGRYEAPKVAYILAVAYTQAADQEKAKAPELLANAAQSYREVLRGDPDSYRACFGLAFVLDGLGDYGSAAANNRRALEIRPQLANAKYNLAIALAKSGDRAGAWHALESIVPGDEGFQQAARAAPVDEDLRDFRGDARFAALPLAQPLPAAPA